MNTNTEIKKWQEEAGERALTANEAAVCMIREISDLRAALEAKQQALEAAQQVAQRARSGEANAMVSGDLPPLTMTLYGTRELLEAERKRRQEAEPYAYDIRDTNGDGCLRLAKDVDPCRLIAVTVTPLYTAPPAAVQPNPIDGYGGLCIGPDRDGVKQMLYAPMDYMTEISKAIHAWRNKQPDSGHDAALHWPLTDAIIKAAHEVSEWEGDLQDFKVEFGKTVAAAMAAQQGEQAPAAKATPDPLRTAVAAFIKAKGRFHTEQGYNALVEAFDATKEVKATL